MQFISTRLDWSFDWEDDLRNYIEVSGEVYFWPTCLCQKEIEALRTQAHTITTVKIVLSVSFTSALTYDMIDDFSFQCNLGCLNLKRTILHLYSKSSFLVVVEWQNSLSHCLLLNNTHTETEFLQFNTYCMSIHEHKGIDLLLVIFVFIQPLSLR